MFPRRTIIGHCLKASLLSTWLLTGPVCRAQYPEDWRPVSVQDLAFKEVPGDNAAPAVLLLYLDYRDDTRDHEFIYQRIKILSPTAAERRLVEIPVPENCSLGDLQARVIRPDGAISAFPVDPSEIRNSNGATRQSFRFPEVLSGTILEFKYALACAATHDPVWTVQHELYSVKESFRLRPKPGRSISYVSSNMPEGIGPQSTVEEVRLDIDNVPAFHPDKLMPPEANFRTEVHFFYGGREITPPDLFWREAGKAWFEQSEKFMGESGEIAAAAAAASAGENDPEKKLRRLYARAQQVKNSGFPASAAGAVGPLQASSAADVLKRGYGGPNQIAEFFVALARAAGFRASLLRASSREERVFDPKLLSLDQLPYEIVSIPLKDGELNLDPGARSCPFGLVLWTHTSVPALKLAPDGGTFVTVPTATADRSVLRRTAILTLDAHGVLRGKISLSLTGNMAVRYRQADQGLRHSMMEEALRSWLPAGGSSFQWQDDRALTSGEEPLAVDFQVVLENAALRSEEGFSIPANVFRSPFLETFRAAERRYPVYFPYTFEEIDKVTLILPQGDSVGPTAPGRDIRLASTRFITTRSGERNQLTATRALVVNSIYFEPQQYQELKNFFEQVRAADGERLTVGIDPQGTRRGQEFQRNSLPAKLPTLNVLCPVELILRKCAPF
jgi:hypothetical protein